MEHRPTTVRRDFGRAVGKMSAALNNGVTVRAGALQPGQHRLFADRLDTQSHVLFLTEIDGFQRLKHAMTIDSFDRMR